ncbi:MAG: hypothetical protein WC869_09265 [Phycisphaerae bacterium]|jgi:hypothetical protein
MPHDDASLRPVSYGFNYLPSVELIEHFAPFWIDNRMSRAQMRSDLLMMRAMNCRFVRFHIMPANPARDCHPGEDPQQSVALIDAAVKFAHDLGLHVHYDIWSSHRMQITPEDVRSTVERLRGLVSSYQIGNEGYWEWSDDCCRHVEKLVEVGRAADPSARWGLDMFPNDLARVRKDFPKLYSMLDVALIHFYAIGGIGGWEPVYIEQLVAHCGGKDNRFEQAKGERFVPSEFYEGEYGQFDRERWITEITACGYHRYAAHVPEETKAANWQQVAGALVQRTDLTVIGYHSFRDKMSWREIGTSQCGMVWIDGTPKPSALTFAKMAGRSLPDDDLARWVKVSVTVENGQAVAKLENRSPKPICGNMHLEAFNGIKLDGAPAELTLPSGGTVEHRAKIASWSASRQTAAHVFATFEAPAWTGSVRTAVGWAWPKRPMEVTLNATPELLGGVKYVGGVASVQDFFRRYPNPAIVTGDVIGFEAEMAYRLRSVIQAVTGQMCDQVATLTAQRVLDKPLIIVGNPSNNYLARVIEHLAPNECRVLGENRSFLAVIEEPFQVKARSSTIANAIGQAFCPACLYVAGADESAIQRATYDLIRRMWLDESVAVSDPSLGQHPIIGRESRTFRIDLAAGPYRLTAMMGQLGLGATHQTVLTFNHAQTAGPFVTHGTARVETLNVEVEKDNLQVTFSAPKNASWAIWGMELAHAGLLAEYRNLVFTSNAQAEAQTRNDILITDTTAYSASQGYGWVK